MLSKKTNAQYQTSVLCHLVALVSLPSFLGVCKWQTSLFSCSHHSPWSNPCDSASSPFSVGGQFLASQIPSHQPGCVLFESGGSVPHFVQTTLSSKQNRHMVRSKASQHLQCSPPATSLFQSTDGTASKNTATNKRGPSTPAASWPNLVATRKPTLLTLQLNSCCNVMSFIIPRSCTWGRWVWHFSTSSSESSHLSCARIKTEIE